MFLKTSSVGEDVPNPGEICDPREVPIFFKKNSNGLEFLWIPKKWRQWQ